jgi:radical SAM protein with 4Fe4S-binding SPASM domain
MYPELFDTLEILARRCHEEGIHVHAGNNLGYFGPHEAKIRRALKAAHYTGCDAGKTAIGIESDGTVKACPSLGGATNNAGNWRDHVGRGGMREIWAQGRGMNYVRERGQDVLWSYCAECYYASVCMAGCTATAEPLLGRPGNNPFCHHRSMVMRQHGLRERVELVKRAPGVPFDHGLYRIVREHIDPKQREQHGPVQIDEPRTSRLVDPEGAGRPLTAEELAKPWA